MLSVPALLPAVEVAEAEEEGDVQASHGAIFQLARLPWVWRVALAPAPR